MDPAEIGPWEATRSAVDQGLCSADGGGGAGGGDAGDGSDEEGRGGGQGSDQTMVKWDPGAEALGGAAGWQDRGADGVSCEAAGEEVGEIHVEDIDVVWKLLVSY